MILLSIFAHSKSQDLPIYKQYMLNSFLLNPAAAGQSNCVNVNFTDRHQWLNFENAPNTQTLSVFARSSLFKTKRETYHGLGAIIFSHKNGLNSEKGFQLTYAFHSQMLMDDNSREKYYFSLGISFVGCVFSFDGSKISTLNPDPNIDNSEKNLFSPDFNAGFLIYGSHFSLGISGTHLLKQRIGSYNKEEPYFPRHYFLFSSYKFDLPDRKTAIEPSLSFKMSEINFVKADFNLKLHLGKLFWVGISYENALSEQAEGGNAINFFTGFFISESFQTALAYQYGFTRIQNYNFGSIEFLLAYKFCVKQRKY